jgi:hypothetical protein
MINSGARIVNVVVVIIVHRLVSPWKTQAIRAKKFPCKRRRGLGSWARAGPIESPSQVGWCGHAGAGFVGTAPVRWPTPLPLLI